MLTEPCVSFADSAYRFWRREIKGGEDVVYTFPCDIGNAPIGCNPEAGIPRPSCNFSKVKTIRFAIQVLNPKPVSYTGLQVYQILPRPRPAQPARQQALVQKNRAAAFQQQGIPVQNA